MDAAHVWNGEVDADYFQFYLQRQGTPLGEEVPDEGYRNHLWTDGQCVMVGTLRQFGTVPLQVELHAAEPATPESHWQHVAEVSLDPGGPLEILNWDHVGLEPVKVLNISPSTVRLRVLWTGLRPNWNGMGMDEYGNSEERLVAQIWQAPPSAPRVIRRWDKWPS